MTRFKLFLLLLLYSCTALSQTQAFFDSKTRMRTMSERWELDPETNKGTFLITAYKPIFILPVHWSDHPNEQPYSGDHNPDYFVAPGINLNNIETKFQISFKTKLIHNIFWGYGDLWGAYTQVSYWQLYNNELSRPFREINYEPEIILNFPIKFKIFGFKSRMVGVAFNHQSNGKSMPFSRSWNRIIFHAGFERKNWSVYIRPWIRLPDTIDDNPDITNLVGRGDVNIIYTWNENVFSLIGSHNLDFGSNVSGNATFSWSHPIKGNLKGYMQVSHGYGESLIDYNYRQTTIGIGVSLIEWL